MAFSERGPSKLLDLVQVSHEKSTQAEFRALELIGIYATWFSILSGFVQVEVVFEYQCSFVKTRFLTIVLELQTFLKKIILYSCSVGMVLSLLKIKMMQTE